MVCPLVIGRAASSLRLISCHLCLCYALGALLTLVALMFALFAPLVEFLLSPLLSSALRLAMRSAPIFSCSTKATPADVTTTRRHFLLSSSVLFILSDPRARVFCWFPGIFSFLVLCDEKEKYFFSNTEARYWLRRSVLVGTSLSSNGFVTRPVLRCYFLAPVPALPLLPPPPLSASLTFPLPCPTSVHSTAFSSFFIPASL